MFPRSTGLATTLSKVNKCVSNFDN